MMLTPEQLAELRAQIRCHEPVSNVLAISIASVKALIEQIDEQQERIAELEQDAARYRYIFNGCTVLLPDGAECEDQQQLDDAMQRYKTT